MNKYKYADCVLNNYKLKILIKCVHLKKCLIQVNFTNHS